MSTRELLSFFEARKNDPFGLVLASVYDTLGSTYSKAGDRMLIAGNGDFQGMLSGGCLEGDLAERAMQVAESGKPQSVTYDLRESDEDLWGLGVGCEGLMRIFLQPLTAGNGFEPFPSLAAVLVGDERGVAATVIESSHPALSPGASMIGKGDSWTVVDVDSEFESAIKAQSADALARGRSGRATLKFEGGSAELIVAVLRPAIRVLLLGGGLDAEPVVRLCAELGWRVAVQDHRPAYVEKGSFPDAEQVTCHPASELASQIDLGRFDAAVCMSHHLVSDRAYLEQLAASDIAYIGLLGPVHRHDRLMRELGSAADRLRDRVHGPAGIDIGGRGPASIALSIVAEMHQALLRRRD